jgi:thioredoxin-related protein
MLGALLRPTAAGSDCPAEARINWNDYEQALAAAKKDGKPVMIFFHDRDCRKCEVLEQQGFDRPDLACYVNQKLISAKVMGKDRPDLNAKYRVSSFPTVWFLTPEAKEIDFFVGYVKPEKLDAIIRYIGDGAYKDQSFSDYEKSRGR